MVFALRCWKNWGMVMISSSASIPTSFHIWVMALMTSKSFVFAPLVVMALSRSGLDFE